MGAVSFINHINHKITKTLHYSDMPVRISDMIKIAASKHVSVYCCCMEGFGG